MACCALVVTGLFLHDRLAEPPNPGSPVSQKAWRDYAVGTMRVGPDSGAVVITMFSDFQCPYCLSLYRSLETLRARYLGKIAIVHRNYPIVSLHPAARTAAIAAECAANVGAFERFYSYLFEHQDSLRTERWGVFARASGIRDTIAFVGCLDDHEIVARLRADSVAARKLNISGTPMFLVNEWQFKGNTRLEVIDSVIRREIQRLRP